MRPHSTFYSENISLIEIYRIYTGYRVFKQHILSDKHRMDVMISIQCRDDPSDVPQIRCRIITLFKKSHRYNKKTYDLQKNLISYRNLTFYFQKKCRRFLSFSFAVKSEFNH